MSNPLSQFWCLCFKLVRLSLGYGHNESPMVCSTFVLFKWKALMRIWGSGNFTNPKPVDFPTKQPTIMHHNQPINQCSGCCLEHQQFDGFQSWVEPRHVSSLRRITERLKKETTTVRGNWDDGDPDLQTRNREWISYHLENGSECMQMSFWGNQPYL